MTRQSENLQRGLFDEEGPRIELRSAQRAELATVIEALLREIADDLDTAPSELLGSLGKSVLPSPAFVIVRQLIWR
jgi:hypothetical protein